MNSKIQIANDALPFLEPDEIDGFITYIHERYNLHSFSISSYQFRMTTLNAYLKQRNNEVKQYQLPL